VKARVPFIIAGVAIVLVIGVFVATQLARPTYVPVGNGIALGPAQRHTPARTDPLAQLATGALDAAAGGALGALPQVDDGQPTSAEQTLLDLTNKERASNGLGPVAFDPGMLRVARVRAAAQIPDGALSHYNGLGELAFVGLLADAGVQYGLAGENLARAGTVDANTVARLHQALMNSPTHRANILEPVYDRLAVGAASPSSDRAAFAEIFRSAGITQQDEVPPSAGKQGTQGR
jgi:uncharacterized protein YkwD